MFNIILNYPGLFIALFLTASTFVSTAKAQPVSRYRPQPELVVSPEISPDRHITFRLLAPLALNVRMISYDMPGTSGVKMTKGTNGIWVGTIGPIEPGTYCYSFNMDGVDVVDPRNQAISESVDSVSSLVNVPGADFMDVKDVPHGAVATVTYYSTTLKSFRRFHVYMPPGYELGKGKFPTLYLLHGSGDNDDTWTSLGRAGFILDNLIAAKKARPMLVVMPAGHTRPPGSGQRGGTLGGTVERRQAADEFMEDFLTDVLPYVETHYRVFADCQHRAIAGLSMGGGQALNIAILHPENFGFVGIFSAGIFGISGGRDRGASPGAMAGPTWEEQHEDVLDRAKLKKCLKLLWFSTGKEDALIETSRATVAMLKKHGFDPVFKETTGGHTWINWRNYLYEFAPLLFK